LHYAVGGFLRELKSFDFEGLPSLVGLRVVKMNDNENVAAESFVPRSTDLENVGQSLPVHRD
jgi:hypothetical protein